MQPRGGVGQEGITRGAEAAAFRRLTSSAGGQGSILLENTAGVLLHSQIRPESPNCGTIWICLTGMRGVREQRFRDGYTTVSL
jgi:hypothetical protein